MTISLLIFDHDRMRGDGWNEEVVEDSVDRFEASVTERRQWD
jgi:tRNA uridine 5-carbamoylmethylation protein Kti12